MAAAHFARAVRPNGFATRRAPTEDAMAFDITLIPGIMRGKGWNTAPKLMDRWFKGPVSIKPKYWKRDTTTVTMAWTLGFARARKTYDEIFDEKLWLTPKAKVEIVKMLKRTGKLTDGRIVPFGDFSAAVPLLDDVSVQYHAYVSQPVFDPLDDLYGALGSFTFKLLLGGRVTLKDPRASTGRPGHVITIEKVGVYVHDSYDFQEDQPLGFWSENNVGKMPWLGYHEVANKSFRDWRLAHSAGADFEVFSDLQVTPLTRPDSFDTPE
jgi:hypothetical protein